MPKLGFEAKLYRLSTGARLTWGAASSTTGFAEGAAPSALDEVGNIVDVSGSLDKNIPEVSVRANNGWAANIAALKRADYTIKMIRDDADPDFIALMTAWVKSNATIALAILSGDKATVGVMGLWADFVVANARDSQILEEGQTVEFTVKPALTAVPPEWVKVTS